MRVFVTHWLVTAVAVAATAWALSGVRATSFVALAGGALAVGLVNACVRPLLLVVTLPLTILTLGLFYLVVNGACFALAAALVPGFHVDSFGSAVAGALLTSLVSWVAGAIAARGDWRR